MHKNDIVKLFKFFRMNREQSLDAKVVVNTYSEQQLAKIFFEYGEEKFSKKIASNIVKARPLNTTGELAEIIEKSYPAAFLPHAPCRKCKLVDVVGKYNRKKDIEKHFL